MKGWNALILLGALALAVVVVWWLIDGTHVYTRTSVPVTVVDELFGTESTEWRDEFHLGFLPSDFASLEMLAVASLAPVPLALILFALWQKRRRRTETA